MAAAAGAVWRVSLGAMQFAFGGALGIVQTALPVLNMARIAFLFLARGVMQAGMMMLANPLVLAIVLGDKAEEAFRQSLLGSQGSLGIFFSNALVSTIMVLGLVALFWGAIQQGYTRLRGAHA